MIVDLVSLDGSPVFRYIADIVPRVGETISTIIDCDEMTWEAISIDHFVARSESRPNFEKEYLQIVNVTVKAT